MSTPVMVATTRTRRPRARARSISSTRRPARASLRSPVVMWPGRRRGRSSARIHRAMVSWAPGPAGRCPLTMATDSGRIASDVRRLYPRRAKPRKKPVGTENGSSMSSTIRLRPRPNLATFCSSTMDRSRSRRRSCRPFCDYKPVIFLINNGGYTIERGYLGKDEAYNDIASWSYADPPKCAVVTRRRDRSSSRPMRIAKALSAPWSSVNQSWTATTLSLPSSTAATMALSSTMARGARKTATTNSGRSQPTTGDRACHTLPTSS